jgi:hypothetical protein
MFLPDTTIEIDNCLGCEKEEPWSDGYWACMARHYTNTVYHHSGITITYTIHKCTEYIFYCKRAILFLSSSKILTPHPPLRPASACVRAFVAGGGQTRRAERGMGGQYFGRREK